jgi:hypothetical protein
MRFAMLLPLLSLVAAVLLVGVPTTLTFLSLEKMSQGNDRSVFTAGNFAADIPRARFLQDALMFGTWPTAHSIAAIDIPGSVAMLLPRPQTLPLDTWRAVVLPFSSLPFWWFAGIGFDAVLRRIQLHWAVCLLGTILMAFFFIMLLGLRFGLSVSERSESDLAWVYWGMSLWTLLFASFPVAWVKRRDNRKLATAVE